MDRVTVSISVTVGPLRFLERFVVDPRVVTELEALQVSEGFTVVEVQPLQVSDRASVLAVVRGLRDL